MALTQVQQELNGLAKQVNILTTYSESETNQEKRADAVRAIRELKDRMRVIISHNETDAKELAAKSDVEELKSRFDNELMYHTDQVYYAVKDELWDASKGLDTIPELYKELGNPFSLHDWFQQRAEEVAEEAEEETDGLLTAWDVAVGVMKIAWNDEHILEDLNSERKGVGLLPLQVN